MSRGMAINGDDTLHDDNGYKKMLAVLIVIGGSVGGGAIIGACIGLSFGPLGPLFGALIGGTVGIIAAVGIGVGYGVRKAWKARKARKSWKDGAEDDDAKQESTADVKQVIVTHDLRNGHTDVNESVRKRRVAVVDGALDLKGSRGPLFGNEYNSGGGMERAPLLPNEAPVVITIADSVDSERTVKSNGGAVDGLPFSVNNRIL